jgi:hypothetical protein
LVECNVGIGVVPATTAERHATTMSIHKIELADDWAIRKLTICVRSQADLPIYARELVRHLAAQPLSRTAGEGAESRISVRGEGGLGAYCVRARRDP